MPDPILSIIMPVYNVEGFVAASIDSVLNQESCDFELIIINDGSTDGSGAICEEYSRRDSRITYISQENRGLSGARNTGISNAKGEYITFIDSDDTVSPDTYGKNTDIIKANPDIDILEFPIAEYFGSTKENLLTFEEKKFTSSDSVFAAWVKNKGHYHNYACNKIFRRSLFCDILFPEKKTYEDIYTTYRLITKSKVYYTSPYGRYFYYLRSGSITASISLTSLYNLYYSALEIYRSISGISGLELERDIYALEIANFIINIARHEKREKTKRLTSESPLRPLSLFRLLSMPVEARQKIKNLPFALSGIKGHVRFYKLIR